MKVTKIIQAGAHGEKYKNMKPPKPWQDYVLTGNILSSLSSVKWIVSIISDGAGSSEHSDMASRYCCEKVYEITTEYIAGHKWLDKAKEISEEEWELSSRYIFSQTRKELLKYAKKEGWSEDSVNCTLILVIETHFGFLTCNIGDGRAFCKTKDTDIPLIVPFQMFSVGLTVFLASEYWSSYVKSNVYNLNVNNIEYYVLASDGCEFLWNKEGIKLEKGPYDEVCSEPFYDSNLVLVDRINPLINSIRQTINQKGVSEANIQLKSYLNAGILDDNKCDYILNEKDDKAIIIGVKT